MGICINLSCKNESELNPDNSSIPLHPHHGYLLGKKEKEYLMKSVNLVPRVLGLFGQRVSARIDSGIIDLNYIFDWPLA